MSSEPLCTGDWLRFRSPADKRKLLWQRYFTGSRTEDRNRQSLGRGYPLYRYRHPSPSRLVAVQVRIAPSHSARSSHHRLALSTREAISSEASKAVGASIRLASRICHVLSESRQRG